MRKIYDFNRKWAFGKAESKIPDSIPKSWDFVNLPHTWNAIDGQDGGNDYFRGTCLYAKELRRSDLPRAERYYLEIQGANSSATVYLNGEPLFRHDGGYSCFRADMTDGLCEDNLIVIAVDNSQNEVTYPQFADFTFYGGLYRKVNIICTAESHFELSDYGTRGVKITPTVVGDDARVDVDVWVKNMKPGQRIEYTVIDNDGRRVTTLTSEDRAVSLCIEGVKKWHGRRSPYLYTLMLRLIEGDKVVDSISERFGCRSFSFDTERGFILNGEEYPLRGVSRHQDRWEIGNALLPEHHKEDMDLILELGASSVRLAHYQHDEYFYDLCDEYGIVVWAEIPYISKHMASGKENTESQMRELITQCYNHPSVVMWGLSNEITMHGESEEVYENHRELCDLAHTMDKTRPTVVAAVSPCPTDSPYLKIPDLVAYNHYFGWYGGDVLMNGPWFDKFHAEHPDTPIGCSEYGCEALDYHTSEPAQGDYTEEYQAYYHEQMIKQLFSRKYLFATYVWNMFDFGADARAEGGEPGQNHKGLVTFDRRYKKDAFYAYKAWLSDEPFVHICGKRYVDRVEPITRVTIYSNLSEVELIVNGKSVGKKSSPDHFFRFDIKNEGESKLVAIAGECRDESFIRKVDKFNEKYLLREHSPVLNWFDITEVKGCLSIKDRLSDIMATEEGAKLIDSILYSGGSLGGFEMNDSMRDMMGSFTLIRLVGMLGAMGVEMGREELLDINSKLNKIRK